jgi:hypothetical protein
VLHRIEYPVSTLVGTPASTPVSTPREYPSSNGTPEIEINSPVSS